MTNTFVQLNTQGRKSKSHPIGYIIQENGCWEWTGQKNGYGYGIWRSTKNGPRPTVHRMMYVRHKGPIPDGLQIDHLCRVRHCVNPDHLEAVTQQENIRRGFGIGTLNAGKTHCKHGHLFDEANTYIRPGGRRQCRKCYAIWNQTHRRDGTPKASVS